MKKTKIILSMMFGLSVLSINAHAQLAESLGVETAPLEQIEKTLTEKAQGVANNVDPVKQASQFTNRFVDNGYVIPGTEFINNNVSGYEGLVGVTGMYGKPQQNNGSTSGGGGNSSSDVGTGLAVAGAVGVGAYAASQLLQSEAFQEAIGNVAGKIGESIKGLDTASDSLGTGGSPIAGLKKPQVELRYGPTPTGDVFSFCNGPRPPRSSQWRYWYGYLCDGNPKVPGDTKF